MMNNRPKLNGWIRQNASEKDRKFAGVKKTVVEGKSSDAIDLRKWASPVEDQRDIGSCVGNACVGALELLRVKQGKPHVDLSRLFCYYNARVMRNEQDKDVGCVIRFAVGTLNTIGTCQEARWPYNTKMVFQRPSWNCYREAYGNKIGLYELISGSGVDRNKQIIEALTGGYPVVFGMDVTEGFMSVSGAGAVNFKGPSLGSHAMLIVGADVVAKKFIVRNSWGTSWGDHGYCYIPFGSLDEQNAGDFWVIQESVSNLGNV
jgi:C1A family cysteine protease